MITISLANKGYLYTYLAVLLGYAMAVVPTSALGVMALVSFMGAEKNDLSDLGFLFFAFFAVGILWVLIVLVAAPLLAFLFLKKYPARISTVISIFGLSICTPFIFYFANTLNHEVGLTTLWLIVYPGLARFIATRFSSRTKQPLKTDL